MILDMLRGAKAAARERMLGDSLVDACRKGTLSQVRRIVEFNDFSPEHREHATGMSALAAGCEGGHLEVVRYLVESAKCDVEGRCTYDGRTPLIVAAISGHVPIIQYLLSSGAQPRSIDMVSSARARVKPLT